MQLFFAGPVSKIASRTHTYKHRIPTQPTSSVRNKKLIRITMATCLTHPYELQPKNTSFSVMHIFSTVPVMYVWKNWLYNKRKLVQLPKPIISIMVWT